MRRAHCAALDLPGPGLSQWPLDHELELDVMALPYDEVDVPIRKTTGLRGVHV
ncbi:hypothetical protein O1M63_26590 [Streptomyces mirabilis]|nr:hypothetical protein [Streptomyces mirabilis]